MTKSIEEQAAEYAEKTYPVKLIEFPVGHKQDINYGRRGFSKTLFIEAAKSRDAEWLKVVNELKAALTKSKDTLQELNSDFGNFIYEDGSEETEQEVKDTYDHVEKTLTKAELMMKEMGQ